MKREPHSRLDIGPGGKGRESIPVDVFLEEGGVGGIPNSVSSDIHVPSGMKEVIEFFNSPGVPGTLSVTPGLVAMKACDAGWPAACFRIPNVCRMSADNYIFPWNDL